MKVSIITANYNCGKYLPDCIKSVRSQDYKNIEHIILDDRSKDNSKEVLRKLSSNKTKCIFSDVRLKCGSAYQRLSHEVDGDIVCVLDADDIIVKGAVSTLVKLYESYPGIEYIWTQFWLCDSKLNKIRRGFSSHPGNDSLLSAGLKGRHCYSHWRTFRRSILEKGEIFPSGLKSAVDKYMGYSLEELGIGGFSNIALYKYRQRVGGLSFTGRKNWAKMKEQFVKKRSEQSIKPFPIENLTIEGH